MAKVRINQFLMLLDITSEFFSYLLTTQLDLFNSLTSQ